MKSVFVGGAIALALVGLGSVGAARAQVTSLSHTFTAADPSGPNRLFRNATPSVAGTPKAFPGTSGANPTYFFATEFILAAGETITTTTTLDGGNNDTFLSLYEGSFDPSNLSLNYRADAGSSGIGTGFGFTNAGATNSFFVVSNTVLGNGGNVGTPTAFDVRGGTLVGGAAVVPEPGEWATMGLAAFSVGGLMLRARRKRA